MNATNSVIKLNPSSIQLVDSIDRVFIIAYKESTQVLEWALTQEGLPCEVLRQEDRVEFRRFSPSYLCLMNHRCAWEKAAVESKPTLVVEADFVPVIGLGKLPLPFNPNCSDVGVSWLYTCASQLYSVSEDGYAEGFSVSTVAYIVTPQAARCLLDFAREVEEKTGGTAYSAWDSNIDSFLRARNLKNYIPFRNYGEHGGRPNPEHHKNRPSSSKAHRADVLYGKLAFCPMYASGERGNRLMLLYARLEARLKGIARLVTGRFLRLKIVRNSSVPKRLLSFAIRKHLSLGV